jgi:hypothetical protein
VSNAPTVIDLKAYRRKLSSVTIDGEGVFEVFPVTGEALRLVDAAREPGRGALLWDAARCCLPGASEAAVLKLSSDEIEAILSIASIGAPPPAKAPVTEDGQ